MRLAKDTKGLFPNEKVALLYPKKNKSASFFIFFVDKCTKICKTLGTKDVFNRKENVK